MMLAAGKFNLMEYLSSHLADHPWPGCTAERLGQRAHLDPGLIPTRIDFSGGRCEDEIHPRRITKLEVFREVYRVPVEIIGIIELGWIHEDRHPDPVGVLPGHLHQRQMTRVERTHGGHKGDAAPGGSLAICLGLKRSDAPDDRQ